MLRAHNLNLPRNPGERGPAGKGKCRGSCSERGLWAVCAAPCPELTATTFWIPAASSGSFTLSLCVAFPPPPSPSPFFPPPPTPSTRTSALPRSCKRHRQHPCCQTHCSLPRFTVGRSLPSLTSPSRDLLVFANCEPQSDHRTQSSPRRPLPELQTPVTSRRHRCLTAISELNVSKMELRPVPPATSKVSAKGGVCSPKQGIACDPPFL